MVTGKEAITRKEAIKRLTNRWHEQCELFPTMRERIPLALYIRANVATVMRNGYGADYAQR